MRTGFAASALAHAAIIAFGLLSLGAAEPLVPDMVESISVDLVPVSEFSNIRVGSLESTVVETDTPAAVQDDTKALLAQPTGNTTEDQSRPTEAPEPSPAPTINTAPEPAAAPAPAPAPDPQPQPEPAPAEPEPVPVPEPEPAAPAPELAAAPTEEAPKEVAPQPVVRAATLEQKRAQFKKDQEDAKREKAAEAARKKEEERRKREQEEDALAKEADQVANIINNENSRGAVTGEGGEPTLGKPTGQSATLSQNQIDALVAQIRGCINVPPGAAEAGASTRYTFSLDQAGNVVGQPQLVQAPASPVEDAYARAALRAIMRCGPYGMAAGQDVSALFNASEF